MTDEYLKFKASGDCDYKIYVSKVNSIVDESGKPKLVVEMSYESPLSMSGVQINFAIPWADKIQLAEPGQLSSDVDELMQRKFVDETWSCAIDSTPGDQKIIAWDSSGSGVAAIPATEDADGNSQPKVLCQIIFTPNTEREEYWTEVEPDISEAWKSHKKSIGVSFDFGKLTPVETWAPVLKDEQSIPNIIANDIFDHQHNGYNLSSDARTAESSGLMSTIHVGDIVACQEVVDQFGYSGDFKNYSQYSVVPYVICERVASKVILPEHEEHIKEQEKDEEWKVFNDSCGCQLVKRKSNEVNGKWDISFSLKYQTPNTSLSGFEFIAELPQELTAEHVQIDFGGDARASGQIIKGVIYSELNKTLLKIISFGSKKEDGDEYPMIAAGGGPVLVNFTLKGISYTSVESNFFSSTKLELFSNDALTITPQAWTGDADGDGNVNQVDVGAVFDMVTTASIDYPDTIKSDLSRSEASNKDLITLSNFLYATSLNTSPLKWGGDQTIPLVPRTVCYDSCRVVWKEEEQKINEDCILEYTPGLLGRVSHTADPGGPSHQIPPQFEMTNLPYDYSPQYKDLIIEVKYKSSCNLAGVQFDLGLDGLPINCYRIKRVVNGPLADSQNWRFAWDVKGISRTVVGLINGCCPEENIGQDIGYWKSYDECPTTGQIPFTLEEQTLCYVILEATKCQEIDLEDNSFISLKKQKGVTLDKSGGRLSSNWTGKRNSSADSQFIERYDFEACLQQITRGASITSDGEMSTNFDANGDGQIDVLDAVFLAEAMALCLPYGPYSSNMMEGYASGGDENIHVMVNATTSQSPRLRLPAYCCDEEDDSCKAKIEIVDLDCNTSEGLVVATVAYQSTGKISGMQFDLATNFTANSVNYIPATSEQQLPHSCVITEHKNVFSSARYHRFVVHPDGSSLSSPAYIPFILPESGRNIIFAKIVYKGVNFGSCDCPSIKYYVENGTKQFGSKRVEYRGKTHVGKDGNLYTGAKQNKKSTRVYKEIDGLSLCQTKIVSNEIRTPIRTFPNPKQVAQFVWNGLPPGGPSTPTDSENQFSTAWGLQVGSNGILQSDIGSYTYGEYKYNLDAGWDGKNDIADFIAAYNWYFSNGAFEKENKPSVVPTYLCNVNNFNNCSRPNCCDAEPCDDREKSKLNLHFGPPRHVESYAQVGDNGEFPFYSSPISIPDSHTIVDVRLCAKSDDIGFVHSVQFELDLPEGTSIVGAISGDWFDQAEVQPDGRTVVVTGGVMGNSQGDVVPAITGEAGPLTVAQVMVTPVLKEKLCFSCGKQKKTVATECCPDAPQWRPYEIYDMGDKVKGIKLFHKETGEEIDPSLYRFLNYERDYQGNPVYDDNGEKIWKLVLDPGAADASIPVVIAESGECWEHTGHFGKAPQALPSAIPGTPAGNRFWTLFCGSSTVTEYEGGTHVVTSPVPFYHPAATLDMFECYERQATREQKDPTSKKIFYNPKLYGATSYIQESYNNVQTNSGSKWGAAAKYDKYYGSIKNSVELIRGVLGTANPNTLNIRDNRYNELTFGECHPCVTCCSPEAETYVDSITYNDGMFFPSGDIDLYLQVSGPNTVDVKFCTEKRISSFQLGIKLTDAYSLVGVDETEGVASNLNYDLTLSEYSSHRDLQNVYVVTGQLSDECDVGYGYSNEVEYIGGCSDGHQTLFRLELASDSQEDAVWGRDVLDAAFESVSMEVLHRVVLAFNKYDPPGMFTGVWDNGDYAATLYGDFIYNSSTQRLCFREPHEAGDPDVNLLGYSLPSGSAPVLTEVDLGANPQNVSISQDGTISVDGEDKYKIEFFVPVPGEEAHIIQHPDYNTVLWYAVDPTDNTRWTEAVGYELKRTSAINKEISTRQLAVDKLRCPPLYPSDVCYSNFITNVLCINKPTKFTAVTTAIQTGYVDPYTGEFFTACDGASEWDPTYDYTAGDKVWVDEECECYEYICEEPPPEVCCCPDDVSETTLYNHDTTYQAGDCVWVGESYLADLNDNGIPKGLMFYEEVDSEGNSDTVFLPNTFTAAYAYVLFDGLGYTPLNTESLSYVYQLVDVWTYNDRSDLSSQIQKANHGDYGILSHAETGTDFQKSFFWIYGPVMNINVSCYKAIQNDVNSRNPLRSSNSDKWQKSENCICCNSSFSDWDPALNYSKFDVVKGCDGYCYMYINNRDSFALDVSGFIAGINLLNSVLDPDGDGFDASEVSSTSYICQVYEYWANFARGIVEEIDFNTLFARGILLAAYRNAQIEAPGASPSWARMSCCACSTAEVWNPSNYYSNGQHVVIPKISGEGTSKSVEFECYKVLDNIAPSIDSVNIPTGVAATSSGSTATSGYDTTSGVVDFGYDDPMDAYFDLYVPDFENDERFERAYCCELERFSRPWSNQQLYPIGTQVWENIIEQDGKYYFPIALSGVHPLNPSLDPVQPGTNGDYWAEIICQPQTTEDVCLNPQPGVDEGWESSWKYAPACIEDCETTAFIKQIDVPEPCEDPECEPICKDVEIIEGCCENAEQFDEKTPYDVGDIVWFGTRDNCWRFVGEIVSDCDENTPEYSESDHVAGIYNTDDLVKHGGKCWRYKGPAMELACTPGTDDWDGSLTYSVGDVVHRYGSCYEYAGPTIRIFPCCEDPVDGTYDPNQEWDASKQLNGDYSAGDVVWYDYYESSTQATIRNCYTYNPNIVAETVDVTNTITETVTIDTSVIGGTYNGNTITSSTPSIGSDQGGFSDTTVYSVGDIVFWNSTYFILRVAPTALSRPIGYNFPCYGSTEYNGNWETWNNATAYSSGTIVKHNGVCYRLKDNCTPGSEQVQNGFNFNCDNNTPSFDPTTLYSVDDIVRYNETCWKLTSSQTGGSEVTIGYTPADCDNPALWNDSSTYATGDFVSYQGDCYKLIGSPEDTSTPQPLDDVGCHSHANYVGQDTTSYQRTLTQGDYNIGDVVFFTDDSKCRKKTSDNGNQIVIGTTSGMVDSDCPGAPTWVAGDNYPQGTVVKHSDGKCYQKANNEFAEPIIQNQNVCSWSDGDTVTLSTTGAFGLPVIADFTVDIIMDCSSWMGGPPPASVTDANLTAALQAVGCTTGLPITPDPTAGTIQVTILNGVCAWRKCTTTFDNGGFGNPLQGGGGGGSYVTTCTPWQTTANVVTGYIEPQNSQDWILLQESSTTNEMGYGFEPSEWEEVLSTPAPQYQTPEADSAWELVTITPVTQTQYPYPNQSSVWEEQAEVYVTQYDDPANDPCWEVQSEVYEDYYLTPDDSYNNDVDGPVWNTTVDIEYDVTTQVTVNRDQCYEDPLNPFASNLSSGHSCWVLCETSETTCDYTAEPGLGDCWVLLNPVDACISGTSISDFDLTGWDLAAYEGVPYTPFIQGTSNAYTGIQTFDSGLEAFTKIISLDLFDLQNDTVSTFPSSETLSGTGSNLIPNNQGIYNLSGTDELRASFDGITLDHNSASDWHITLDASNMPSIETRIYRGGTFRIYVLKQDSQIVNVATYNVDTFTMTVDWQKIISNDTSPHVEVEVALTNIFDVTNGTLNVDPSNPSLFLQSSQELIVVNASSSSYTATSDPASNYLSFSASASGAVAPQEDSVCWELAQEDPCCVEAETELEYTLNSTDVVLAECRNQVPNFDSPCWEKCEGGIRIEQQCEEAPCLPCCPDALPYDPELSYDFGDMVAHNDKCWKSISEGVLVEPGTPSSSSIGTAEIQYYYHWEEYTCERDCIELGSAVEQASGISYKSGKVTIPVWYKASCLGISGFSFKITGVPDCEDYHDYYGYDDYYAYGSENKFNITLSDGIAGLSDFMLTAYTDEYGDIWVTGVLSDLTKLIQPTDNNGRLLTNVIINIEAWKDCFDWSEIKICNTRFVSNAELSEPHNMWTGDVDSSGYIDAEDVESAMKMIGESWNSYNFEGPWKEFIDAEYDGMIRIEDAVAIQNHRLMNADDSGQVRAGMTVIDSSGNSVYGTGLEFDPTNRTNLTRSFAVSRNIVPQVCCEEELYADCLCPCDEPVEEPCFNNIKVKLVPTRIKSKTYNQMVAPTTDKPNGNKVIDGYFLQVYYSSSCCIDGYWVEFDGIKNIPGAELNIYPAANAEPVKKKWLQYTGWGEDSYLVRGPLDLVPTNVIFGWYRAPYVRQDGSPSFTGTGPSGNLGTALTHYSEEQYQYDKSCIPATDLGEWKVLATVFVRKDAVGHDEEGKPIPPTVKKSRLITNEKMNMPAVGWTGDVTGWDPVLNNIILAKDNKVGGLDAAASMLAAIVGATGAQVPDLDAEGDGRYLDIVDIVTIWNHYTETLMQAIIDDGPIAVLNGAPLPKPMKECVPTDCCPDNCEDKKPTNFTLKVVDCKQDPNFGCEGKYPNSIGLIWSESENASGYKIFRSDNPLYPVHVSYDPSVRTWIDRNPPIVSSEEAETISIGSGKNKITIEKDGCCSDDDIGSIKYVVVAFNDCGEVVSNTGEGSICCCNEGPQAYDIAHHICMNETFRGVLFAYDPNVPPLGECPPFPEECDALYYEIISVTNGVVTPPPGGIQPGPFGQFIFKPENDFVGIATIEYRVWDTSGCWDCGIIRFLVLPESPKITRLDTFGCGEPKYGQVIVSWNNIEAADRYKVYRRKLGEEEWVHVATVEAPNSSYSDNSLPELPVEGCTEGIEYEYVVSSVKDVIVSWESLQADCDESQDTYSKFSKKNKCCEDLQFTNPVLYDKVKKYEAEAQKFGWQKICFATRLFLLNKGFTWYEIGILDCCCKKPFYEIRDVNDVDQKELKIASGLSTEEARSEYKRGYTECCNEPFNTSKVPEIVELESCIEGGIPKPVDCCGEPQTVEIECCESIDCDDWTVNAGSSDCDDSSHPTLSVWWQELPSASTFRVTVVDSDGNAVSIQDNLLQRSEINPHLVGLTPCYCPETDKQYTVRVAAFTASGVFILECEDTVTVECCPIPMNCPPVEDRTWFTDKNESVFDKVPSVVNNNPNCNDDDIKYYLVTCDDNGDGVVDDEADCCCPDYDGNGTSDCGPFNGKVYKKSTFTTAKEEGIDENGEFVYVPNPHWVSQYDEDGNPLLPTEGGPDSFTYKAIDCCGEEICCTVTIHVVIDICDENDYVICDATIAYLSSQFVKNPTRPGGEIEQVPFSLNRRGGQTIRKTKRAYVVTKGMNPLLDPDYE